MSRIQVNHIKQALDNLFADKIDVSDVKSSDSEEITVVVYW